MKLLKKIAVLSSLLVASSVFAETAEEVVTRFTSLPVPDFSKATMLLDVYDAKGNVEHREMIEYGSGLGKNVANVVFDFQKPASMKGTRILQAAKTNKEDDRWIYDKSIKEVRRIGSSERSKSFVGCEFTYNDMTIRKANEDRHEMLGENETINVAGTKYNCWKIKSTPIKKNDIEYSSRICWYDKETLLPVKMDYYDKANPNKIMKTFTIEKIDHVKGVTGKSYVLRRSCLIENFLNKRKTRVTVKDFVFDDEHLVSDRIFTQNWLRTGK
ncbi:MAG: outer membrane lipoprotein-sorting protein [Treponema sp.]|nr:outer membrane lipoprotein-sorting protein [Treponema sp.]